MDITDHKTTEKQLADAIKAKKIFLRIISHEVKAPLANTLYILNLLKEKLQNSTDHLEECFEMIDAEIKDASRGIETIHYLFHFFNLEKNIFFLEKKTEINIRQELMSLIDIFDQKNEKQLAFEIIKDKDFPYFIKIHPLFYEVATILLRNAVKYSYPNGKITIRLSQFTKDQQNYVQIIFEDNGTGINQETANHLFSPLFNTNDEPLDHLYRSPAIKLSYAKKIVECLGGSLIIQSSGVGQGTQASFTMAYENAPYFRQPTLAVERTEYISHASPITKKLAILIVEDNSVTSYLLKKELIHMGHHVTTAFDSFEAKTYAAHENYDVIFMDISLPGMDGVELRQLISQPQSDKPIFIAVTSHDSEQDINYFLDHGFVTVINKPFLRADILECIGTVQKVLDEIG